MRRILLIACFICLGSSAFAQKVRFTDTSNSWTFICIGDPNNPNLYTNTGQYWLGDTLIDGSRYSYTKSIFIIANKNRVFFRDDAAARKVYFRIAPSDTDKVFMDFTLQLHDTIEINGFKTIVRQLDSVIYNGFIYRRQVLEPIDSLGHHYQQYEVVEGFGASFNILYPLEPTGIELWCHLCSFSDRNQTISITNCKLAIKSEGLASDNVTTQPNPIQDNSIIHFPLLKEGEMLVYNAFGQILFQESIANQSTFPIGLKLPQAGIYYFKIVSRDSQYRGKIVRL